MRAIVRCRISPSARPYGVGARHARDSAVQNRTIRAIARRASGHTGEDLLHVVIVVQRGKKVLDLCPGGIVQRHRVVGEIP